MTKNEFMVRMHDLMEKERFILKLQSDGMIPGIVSRTVILELVEEATKIRTSYFPMKILIVKRFQKKK